MHNQWETKAHSQWETNACSGARGCMSRRNYSISCGIIGFGFRRVWVFNGCKGCSLGLGLRFGRSDGGVESSGLNRFLLWVWYLKAGKPSCMRKGLCFSRSYIYTNDSLSPLTKQLICCCSVIPALAKRWFNWAWLLWTKSICNEFCEFSVEVIQ